MNSNGEILVYSLLSQAGELMYKSEPYTVVLYKNPSWIFRCVDLRMSKMKGQLKNLELKILGHV